MKGVLRRVRKHREFNLLLARWAALKLRPSSTPFTPALLEEIQCLNRELRQSVDIWRAELRRRRALRSSRITRRFGSSTAVHAARREHDRALKALLAVLDRREFILYQIGDTCAWIVLGGRTRVLYPLYGGGKQHPLPRDEGLDGPVRVASTAHALGEFLVIHNDLTRCLTTGDLTVVLADGDWQHPLVYEVKTSKPNANGKVLIGLHGVEGGAPIDVRMSRRFRDSLGFEPDEPAQLDPRGERQVAEIAERTELMQQISDSGIKPLGPGSKSLWRALGNVLRRAVMTGSSYDVLEGGVYILALRVREGKDVNRELREILGRLNEDVFARSPMRRWGTASSDDLITTHHGAAFIPPVLLWRVAPDLAAMLVAGELFMAGYVRDDVWRDAFRAQDVDFKEDEDSWILTSGSAEITFGPLEVQKLRAGVIFTGISPQGVAEAAAKDLARRSEQVEGDRSSDQPPYVPRQEPVEEGK